MAPDDRTLALPPPRSGKPVAVAALAALIALGWVYLGLMVAGSADPAALGPGMGVLGKLGGGELGRALAALCRPAFGHHHAGPAELGLVFLMWTAMVLAMMLPTAIPMILAYADTGRGGRAGPLALTAGYAAVWLGFAVLATLAQAGLTRAALLDPAMASASPLFSGAIFLAAGAYQFSALKQACVTRCQRPKRSFFAGESAFRLGMRQGLHCLGCCFALMLVMFAVGTMNLVWMAALGVVMAAEKISTTTRFSRVVGVALLAIGTALIVAAVAAQWPA